MMISDRYERLRINSWMKELNGETFNARLQKHALGYLYEEKLQWAAKHHAHLSPEVMFGFASHNGEILDCGGSIPSDLILNNFGLLFGGLFRSPVATSTTVALTNSADVSENLYSMYSASGGSTFNNSASANAVGSQLQAGSGTTTPALTDYKVTTALGTSPESGAFNTGSGSYAAGAMTVSGSVTAGGSGTVNEGVLFGAWSATNGAIYNFALVHDLVTSFGYVASNSITLVSAWTV